MTASTAKSTYTTTIARNGTTIAEVTKIGGISMKAAGIDITHLNSDYGFHEYVQGFSDGGSLPIEGNFIPGDTDGIIGLQTDHLARTVQTFVITLPTAMATTWTFSAFVEEFAMSDLVIDGKVSFSASLKISGKPVLAITASTGLTTPFFVISESALIVPAAANAVYTYNATVLTGVTSVTVTPTATAGTITVAATVGGTTTTQTVATGVASSAITLGAAGTLATIVITVTETSKTSKTYTIYLARASS